MLLFCTAIYSFLVPILNMTALSTEGLSDGPFPSPTPSPAPLEVSLQSIAVATKDWIGINEYLNFFFSNLSELFYYNVPVDSRSYNSYDADAYEQYDFQFEYIFPQLLP